jgi:hypothetical protein
MKPNPLASLNHLTVPVCLSVIFLTPCSMCELGEAVGAKQKELPGFRTPRQPLT